jgi:hypothetical protein
VTDATATTEGTATMVETREPTLHRHPTTGRLVSAADARRMEERQPTWAPRFDDPPPPVDEPLPEPIRVWTAGPNLDHPRIFVRPGVRLVVGPDYAYSIRTKQELERAKAALGRQFWKDDVPADEEPPRCESCQWTSHSMRAMFAHMAAAHGRPQGTR